MVEKLDIEILSCGHQNNLRLNGQIYEGSPIVRESGKCPKGCVNVTIEKTNKAELKESPYGTKRIRNSK